MCWPPARKNGGAGENLSPAKALNAIRPMFYTINILDRLIYEDWHDRLIYEDWHDRVDALPKSPEEAEKRGFIKASDNQNRYHRNKGETENVKYYHPITGQEVVFDRNGKVVTTPENRGTKNYGPNPTSREHVIYDIIPYWIWGNSEDDTTPFWDRVWGTGK
jgi:hypothetical protein